MGTCREAIRIHWGPTGIRKGRTVASRIAVCRRKGTTWTQQWSNGGPEGSNKEHWRSRSCQETHTRRQRGRTRGNLEPTTGQRGSTGHQEHSMSEPRGSARVQLARMHPRGGRRQSNSKSNSKSKGFASIQFDLELDLGLDLEIWEGAKSNIGFEIQLQL